MMGTNYYWEQPAGEQCPTCGHIDDTVRLHIGKSSAGWVFLLHVIPEQNLNTLGDWKTLWETTAGQIRDEFGEAISVTDMIKEILERSYPRGLRIYDRTTDTARVIRPDEPTYCFTEGDFS